MCKCVNVEIGSYGNQVELPRPDHMVGRTEGTDSDTICVDTCLSDEIKSLWNLGIITTGCCCGHNKRSGYIGVLPKHSAAMVKLGYSQMDEYGHFKLKNSHEV